MMVTQHVSKMLQSSFEGGYIIVTGAGRTEGSTFHIPRRITHNCIYMYCHRAKTVTKWKEVRWYGLARKTSFMWVMMGNTGLTPYSTNVVHFYRPSAFVLGCFPAPSGISPSPSRRSQAKQANQNPRDHKIEHILSQYKVFQEWYW